MQLWGVAFISAQIGLGEASLLALGGKYDAARPGKNQCLTSFSSGTGIAGVVGFFWKVLLVNWMGLSLQLTLWLANVLAVAYATIYIRYLWDESCLVVVGQDSSGIDDDKDEGVGLLSAEKGVVYQTLVSESVAGKNDDNSNDKKAGVTQGHATKDNVIPVEEMTAYQRFRLVVSLYPYMIPLSVSFAAEYSLQSGTWTAIGFPVTSLEARNQFYEYSNWMVRKNSRACQGCSRLLTKIPCLLVSDWGVLLTVFGDVVYGSHVVVVVNAGFAVFERGVFLVGSVCG